MIHLTVEAIIESCLFTPLVKSQSVYLRFTSLTLNLTFCCEGLRVETKCYQRLFLTWRAVYLRVYTTGRGVSWIVQSACSCDCLYSSHVPLMTD